MPKRAVRTNSNSHPLMQKALQIYESIIAILRDCCPRKDDELAVWELRRKGIWGFRQMEPRKKSILQLSLALSPVCFLVFSEDPTEDGLPGDWKRASNGAWIIPNNLEFASFYNWLALGNWLIYAAEKPCDKEDWKKLASGDFKLMSHTGKRISARFAIYSFYDDNPWFIYLPHPFEETD